MRTEKFMIVFICSMMSTALWAADCSKMESQADLTRCFNAEYESVDKELNKVYASYRTSLVDDRQRQDLREVQRAWIKYRDLSCRFELSASKGGSSYPMGLAMCLADKTRVRMDEIKKLASCEEGDIACPPIIR